MNLIRKFTSTKGWGITLTVIGIKDIIKVIKSLENRRILSKRNTKKITSPDGWVLNFLTPLMTAGLPLMISVLTPLAKSVFYHYDYQQEFQQQMQLFKRTFMGQEWQHW